MSEPHKQVWKAKDIRYGYTRIGIYYPKLWNNQIHQVNFCDLHWAGALMPHAEFEGIYTGPNKRAKQITGGNWGIGGKSMTTADVKALAAGKSWS